ncbi:MAG TPA: hypothetical protein VF677_05780 [Flavobacterium sp.]|jgi:hypothetical protein
MAWSENDLKNLKAKGYKIEDSQDSGPDDKDATETKPKARTGKISVEKNTIELFLKQFQQQGIIESYTMEYRFDEFRKFRFDYAIPSVMIAIEYEGIMSSKSRHTTVGGYSKDIEKYNLAVTQGWKVLRYTAMNYQDLYTDLEKLLHIKSN